MMSFEPLPMVVPMGTDAQETPTIARNVAHPQVIWAKCHGSLKKKNIWSRYIFYDMCFLKNRGRFFFWR